MGDKTHIQWTEATWNPVTGCSRVSEGCRNCYAEQLAGTRMRHLPRYQGLTRQTSSGPRWTGEVRMDAATLAMPLRWTRPRRVFVNSMSDLFHEGLEFEVIAAIFGVMAAAPRHTFQVLTKRPQRALDFFAWLEAWASQVRTVFPSDPLAWRLLQTIRGAAFKAGAPVGASCSEPVWPLPNVHLGVSVEDQASADARIPLLLQLPAAVRWLSMEPLLEAVNLSEWVGVIEHCGNCGAETPGPVEADECPECGREGLIATFGGESEARWYRGDVGRFRFDVEADRWRPYTQEEEDNEEGWNVPRLDWIVVGGESGPGARPFDLAWARRLVGEAREAGVPVFVKQLGSAPVEGGERLRLSSSKGADMEEWPADLRVREWPA